VTLGVLLRSLGLATRRPWPAVATAVEEEKDEEIVMMAEFLAGFLQPRAGWQCREDAPLGALKLSQLAGH